MPKMTIELNNSEIHEAITRYVESQTGNRVESVNLNCIVQEYNGANIHKAVASLKQDDENQTSRPHDFDGHVPNMTFMIRWGHGSDAKTKMFENNIVATINLLRGLMKSGEEHKIEISCLRRMT